MASGNYASVNVFQMRSAAKIIWGAGNDHVVILVLAYEAERAAADGMLREIRGGVGGNDSQRGAGHVPEEGCVRGSDVENNCGRIGGFDAGDEAVCAAFWRVVGDITNVIQSEFYVGGR